MPGNARNVTLAPTGKALSERAASDFQQGNKIDEPFLVSQRAPSSEQRQLMRNVNQFGKRTDFRTSEVTTILA